MKNKELQKAITSLATLKDGWALMADTIPSDFIADVEREIRTLRKNQGRLNTRIEKLESSLRKFAARRGPIHEYTAEHASSYLNAGFIGLIDTGISFTFKDCMDARALLEKGKKKKK